MADPSNAIPRRHHRANWVALRTLHQVPKLLGETGAGEPIVEVRSVRLVLRDGATNFTRILVCSRCGRDVPGAPVLTAAELDRVPQPVLCQECVRGASEPMRVPANGAVAEPGRLTMALLEQRLSETMELVMAQRLEWEAVLDGRLRETRDEVRSLAARPEVPVAEHDAELRDHVDAQLTVMRAELDERVEDRFAGLQAAFEAQSGRARTGLAKVDEVRKALAKLDRELDRRVAPTEQELARIEEQLNDRLDRMAERMARAAPDDQRVDALELDLEEGLARLSGLAESRRADVQRAVRAALAEAHAADDAVEGRAAVRLEHLEGATEGHAALLSELGDLQGALDVGLGELRSQLNEVQGALDKAATRDRRLEAIELPSLPAADAERARRGRRPAELTAQLASISTAVESLVHGHEQVRVAVATLGTEADTATRASIRATAQAAAVAPMRDDVRALRDELDAQRAALTRLGKSVDELRSAVLPAKPAVRRVAKPTVKPAAKAVKATKKR